MAGGRPSEMTPEKVKKLEEAFALDSTIEEACYYADITKTTYYNWLEKNPELVDRFTALRNRPVLAARQTIWDNIKSDPKVAQWYLERKRKDEFSSKQEVQVSGELQSIREKIGDFLDETDNPADSETTEREYN